MDNVFPWKEAAVVVEAIPHEKGIERIAVFEGSLIAAADFLHQRPLSDRHRFCVSLPDRRVPPTRFSGLDLERLLTARSKA
jgi:hypothetical protein